MMTLKFPEESKNLIFDCYYDPSRFFYIHHALMGQENFRHAGSEKIKKTAVFESNKLNVYVDTSDGVNDDLNIEEYCGRIKRIILDAAGRPFLFFKAAYSEEKSKKIVEIAKENNGKVIPFFKWSFNPNFYNQLMGRREAINTKYSSIEKEYDIGYFCGLKPYKYPKPSSIDPLISWTDHKGFDLPGESKDTGNFLNSSRQDVLNTLKQGNFKILHLENLSYEDYIEQSYKCKVVFNPPGMGEYTSRMMDQCYLGNCIVMRENSYDQGYTWKNIIPEVDLRKSDWQNNLSEIIENSSKHAENCRRYFDEFWNPVSVSQYLISKIIKEKNDI